MCRFLELRFAQSLVGLAVAYLVTSAPASDPCGDRGQRCCTIEDGVPPEIPRPNANYGRIDQYDTPDARFCNDYENDVCDPVTKTCIAEEELPCGKLGEPCCDLAVDVAGDYPSTLRCFDSFGGYVLFNHGSTEDLYCDTVDLTCKEFKDLTSCGNPGLRCCTDADRNTSEGPDFSNKYRQYSPYCLGSFCTDGICEACNKPGDKCCLTIQDNYQITSVPFCVEPTVCLDGTCEACGKEGELCCGYKDGLAYSTILDNYQQLQFSPQCDDGLECVENTCVKSAGGEPGIGPGMGPGVASYPTGPGLYGEGPPAYVRM